MDGKVIVVTGALGALGSVVADEALARGARIASVDHAPTQVPATADLFELGGVDLTDAAQAKKAIDAAASHFGKIDALISNASVSENDAGNAVPAIFSSISRDRASPSAGGSKRRPKGRAAIG